MARVKLTEGEKQRRKMERKAASLNAAALRDAGGPNSPFTAEAVTYTRDDAYWHWRHTIAAGIELLHQSIGPGQKALAYVRLACIESHARTLCGEHFDGLKEHMHRTYPSVTTYGYGYRQAVLTGEKVVYGWSRVANPAKANRYNPEGYELVESGTCQLSPAPMTRDEFHKTFPYTEPVEYVADHDDGGLFDRVMHALQKGS